MNNRITPDEARAALDSAATTSGRVRAHARWMSTYLAVYSAGFFALVLVLGLVDNVPVRVWIACVGWVGLMVATVFWARRRAATLPGTGWRTAPYWIATSVLYAAALIVGFPEREGQVWYWVPAAIIVALPNAIGALRERRA